MDARPVLEEVAAALNEAGLEAVLIGNAAAALQGAPVTTIDLDFFYRKSAANARKLKAVAAQLRCTLFKPHYPVSGLTRLMRDEDGVQLDFMVTIHGARSFVGVRSRSREVALGPARVLVAGLADIIRSKRAADRPRDRAVLDILEKTHAAQKEAKP